MSRSLLAASAVAIVVVAVSHASAQRFGTSGMSSSRFGSSGFGSSGLGSSSFGSSGFGSSSFGSSGFGSSSFGSSGFGSSSFGSSGFGSSGFGGSSFGSQGFGGGMGGGQNFVGRDSGDMANTWNQMGQAGAQFFNQMNRSMGRNRNNNNSDNQDSAKVENPKQEMRVNLQVAFTPPRPSQVALTNSIRTRLGTILAAQNIIAPQVTLDGDVAVLRGIAATEGQRLVLEKLVAMEPGVGSVRNEMTVATTNATE